MTASKRNIGSDFAKADAYVNTSADYDEIPNMADRALQDGFFQSTGVPRIGRPPAGERTKQAVSLRLDPATLERFKAAGPGWQTRMGSLLARNDLVLKMIRDNLELIDGMEKMLTFMRKGELRAVFEPIAATMLAVEQNIRIVAETTRSLRDQLVTD